MADDRDDRKSLEVVPATPSRGALQRGILAYRDVLDQPKGKYLVIVDVSTIQSLLFAVDSYTSSDKSVSLYMGNTVVASFNSAMPWYAVSADYVDVLDMKTMMERNAQDGKDIRELVKSLRPDPKELVSDMEGMTAEDLTKALNGGTGQYL